MEQIIAVVVGVVAILFACSAFAAEAAAGPDAASLIRDMRNAESWVDQVKSLEMVVESTWSLPEEAIARRRVQLAEKFPGTDITPETHPELRALSTSRAHFAFDGTRVYFRWDGVLGPETSELRTWDGNRLVAYARYDAQNEHYLLDSSTGDYFGMVLGHFTWLRATPHRFWFMPAKFVTPEEELGRPEDFHLVGRELFHEVDCYVVERTQSNDVSTRWYVGVQDHRSYGYQMCRSPAAAEKDVISELARKDGQVALDEQSLRAWAENLNGEKRERLMAEYREKLREKRVVSLEAWCVDYREVSTGYFAPMAMGYSSFNTDDLPPRLNATHEMKVTKLLVDQPLADALFTVEFKEGVQVNDSGHEPPLSYKYKKDRTLEEWQEILDEANARQDHN